MNQIVGLIAITSLSISSIYWLIILINILRYSNRKSSNQENAEDQEGVSVIVCAHNELHNLQKLIPILINQNHPNFEIIIVDDRSDDGTYDYLLENQTNRLRYVRVDSVHDHINAKKYALTLGVKAAKNDKLLFTDGDCFPVSNEWVSRMTSPMSKSTQFVLGVSQYIDSKSFLSEFIRFETQTTAMNYVGFALAGNPYMGVGRNMAYRKSYFLQNKGFHGVQEVVGGDDDLLVNKWATKTNTQIVIGESSMVHSTPKTTWGEYRTQKTRHWAVGKHYKFKDKLILGFQNFNQLVFWIAFIILALQVRQANELVILGAILLLRISFLTLLHDLTSKKFGDRINLWLVPILDVVFTLYSSVFGGIALLTKKIKWKK